MTKNELLKEMLLEYWQWDVEPDFDNVLPNSPEYFILQMYDNKKNIALSRYPWRSAIKYVDIVGEIPTTYADRRYKYENTIPENFVMAVGFWRDKERRLDAHNDVDIVGRKARTNMREYTMGYIDKDIPEEDLDPWVCEYLKIFLATELSDIGGISPDRKNFLLQKEAQDLIVYGNKDYEMSQRDPVSSSIYQYLWY